LPFFKRRFVSSSFLPTLRLYYNLREILIFPDPSRMLLHVSSIVHIILINTNAIKSGGEVRPPLCCRGAAQAEMGAAAANAGGASARGGGTWSGLADRRQPRTTF
jgi:hypothetical protein